jgi:hypothetical protein
VATMPIISASRSSAVGKPGHDPEKCAAVFLRRQTLRVCAEIKLKQKARV